MSFHSGQQKLYSKKYFAIAFFLTMHWLTQIAVFADTPPIPREQIILLTNRQVLRGEVALYGDRYLITQSNSEIRLPRERVERLCQDLEEAYLHLQHQIRFGTAGDHLQLAQWCLDENLYTEAQRQLEEAMLKRPNHPRIDLVRRQLELAKTEHSTSVTENPHNQSSYNADELEEVFKQMPSGMVESFTRVVQPLLLNSCSTRGCHGLGGANQFLLHRAARGQQPSRRITLRNLQSVLTWIDRENVAKSPLLHFAETPHFSEKQKSMKKYFFAPGSPSAQRLTAWVENFSENRLHPVKLATSTPLATDDYSTRANTNRSDALFNWTGPAVQPDATSVHNRVDWVKPPVKFRPRDPFDAEIFNRRHHP